MSRDKRYYTFGKVECTINGQPFGTTELCNGNWESHPRTYEMFNKHTLPYYKTKDLLKCKIYHVRETSV